MPLVGFTGTREGMTERQLAMVKKVLERFEIARAHHGDCRGADKQFHDLAKELGATVIVVHPPENDKFRAFCKGDVILSEKPYIERNHDIVDAVDVLVAAPKNSEEDTSGTWATIRYAEKDRDKIPIVTVMTDGKLRVKGKKQLTKLSKKVK